MQLIVFVAATAEYFLCLNDLGRETIAMDIRVFAGASLDELRRDFELLEVSLLLDRVGFEHSHEF